MEKELVWIRPRGRSKQMDSGKGSKEVLVGILGERGGIESTLPSGSRKPVTGIRGRAQRKLEGGPTVALPT